MFPNWSPILKIVILIKNYLMSDHRVNSAGITGGCRGTRQRWLKKERKYISFIARSWRLLAHFTIFGRFDIIYTKPDLSTLMAIDDASPKALVWVVVVHRLSSFVIFTWNLRSYLQRWSICPGGCSEMNKAKGSLNPGAHDKPLVLKTILTGEAYLPIYIVHCKGITTTRHWFSGNVQDSFGK